MSKFEVGDLVVLTSGSMRMAVEAADGDQIAVVWCHEGEIGRDAFHANLLRKWEAREDDGNGPRSNKGPRDSASRSFGDRNKGKPSPSDKPKGKPGWDGKPREKKYFRKD